MIEKLRNLVWDEEGQGMVEYGLIIALISVVVIAILTLMGTNLRDKVFKPASDKLAGS